MNRSRRVGRSLVGRKRLLIELLEDRRLLAVDSLGGPWATFNAPDQYHLINRGAFLTGPASDPPIEIAFSYLVDNSDAFGLAPEDLANARITSSYTSTDTGITHIYLRQTVGGLDVSNADISIHVSALGEVISAGGGFIPGLNDLLQQGSLPRKPLMEADEAVARAGVLLGLSPTTRPAIASNPASDVYFVAAPGISLDHVTASLKYVPVSNEAVTLSWELIVRTPDNQHWYELGIDAESGVIRSQADWVNDASYTVLPIPTDSPDDGPFQTVVDPHLAATNASPFGWHDTNGVAGAESTLTIGNNVDAHLDRDGNNVADTGGRPDGGASLNFNSVFNPALSPQSNANPAVTNLFYWNNVLHDVHYQYGFTPVAGNFQTNNYSQGGLGNDAVQADAQDNATNGSTNNANFATPPDGSAPRMQMFEFTSTSPRRDSDMDVGIIVHEYGHGVSNRLTGGPANSSALDALQSGGMGEGWSDWWSLMFGQSAASDTTAARGVGTYVLGQGPTGLGIRDYRYDFDIANQNLETFLNFGTGTGQSTQVHDVGTRWASTLWDLNHLLIQKYGYEPNIYNGTSLAGNTRALHLVMNGLKLQPANPSLINARDAILTADTALYGSVNQCEIWTAFARRGLGQAAATASSASSVLTTSFAIPAGACGFQVATTVPAVGSSVATPPVNFAINFSNPANPATIAANDLFVNSVPANSVVVSNGNMTATFSYTVSPVVNQGLQAMNIAANAMVRASDSDGIDDFNGSFRLDVLPLAVTTTVPPVGGILSLVAPTIFDVNFNEPIDPNSVSTDDLTLSIGTVIGAVPFDADTARYTISGISIETNVTISLAAGKVTDVFGNANPSAFTGNYVSDVNTVAYPLPLTAKNPLGSLVYDPTIAGTIGNLTDTDNYTISVDPGQNISVYLDPASSLKGLIRLYDSANNLLGSATNTSGLDAVIQTVATGPSLDTYRIEVSSDGGLTTGAYTLGLLLNARKEAETHNGPANNTVATAEDINGSFIALSGSASRGAVIGSATGSDYYQFSVTSGDTVSLALQSLSNGTMNVSLIDPSGVQIATAVAGATNVSRVLRNFVAASTGNYRALVTTGTNGTTYNFVVLKNADFDAEANDSSATAQYISGADGALGHIQPVTPGLGRLFIYEATGSNANGIREINPLSGAILNSFPSPTGIPVSPDAGLATTPTSLLVANDANGNIFELNPNTGALIRTITTSVTTIAGLAFLNNEIYIRSDAGTITVLDYVSGTIARSFASTSISEDLAASGGRLYGTSANSLYDVNPLTGAATLVAALSGATNIEGLGILGNELFASEVTSLRVYDLTTLALLRTLTGYTNMEAVGADGGTLGSDDWYSFAVNAGDGLVLQSSTPADGPGNFVNIFNPKLELYAPSGGLVASGVVQADGRNETILHTATVSGVYRVRVGSEGNTQGEYFVSITGNTDTVQPPFQVVASVPANGASFSVQPTSYTVDFNDVILITSLQALDLKVNGNNATSLTFVDGDTAQFTLPGGLLAGVHTVTIASGDALDIQNTPLQAFSATFTIDNIAPRVVATSIAPNGSIAPGSLSYSVTFSEPMKTSNILATGDFTLHGNFRQAVGTNYTPSSFSFNPLGTVLTLNYVGLPDDDYTLTLTAGATNGTNFTDVAGLALDGDFSGVFPSGNGAAGGNFVIGFDMDVASEPYPTLASKIPLGSLIYDPSLSRAIVFPGDVDEFVLNVDSNQTISVVVTPTSLTLQPRVELFDPANVSLSFASGAVAGDVIGIQTRSTTTAGTYRIVVSGLNGTQGLYTVEVILNSAYEVEGRVTGSTNNTSATAQNINGSFINLDTTLAHAQRGAVIGTNNSSSNLPNEIEPNNTQATANSAIGNFIATSGNLFHLGIKATSSVTTDQDYFNIGSLQVGDILTISLSGSASSRGTIGDAYLRLWRGTAASPIQVTVDDDSGPGLDSLIYRFTISTADTYYVNADPAVFSTTGNYDLGIHLENTGTAPTTGGLVTGEVESNDTIGTATNVSTSWRAVQYLSRTAGEITAGDTDFYSYQFSAGSLVTVNIDSLSTLDARVNLRNSAGTIIAVEDGTSSGPSADSPIYSFIIPSTGGYAVEVLAASGTGIYNADILLSTTTPPPIASSAEDYYSFSANAGQRVTLALSSFSSTNVDVQLIGTNGTTILASGVSGALNLNEVIPDFAISATGTYFARVTSLGNVVYSLVVTKDAAFDTESNNTFATAQSLNGLQGVLGHVQSSASPASRFNFETGNQGFIVNDGTTGLWHLTRQRGTQAGHSAITSFHYGREAGNYSTGQPNSGSIVSPVITLPSTGSIPFSFNYILETETVTSYDTADVQVSNNNFATFTTLASRSTNLPNTLTWQSFASDLSAFAGQNIQIRWIFNTIDSGVNDFAGWFVDDIQIGVIDDADWYTVTLPAIGEQLRIETRTPADGTGEFINTLDPRVELYRPDGSLLVSGTPLADGRNEFIQINAPQAGNYRVRVIGQGAAGGEYFLGATVGNPSGPIVSQNSGVVNRQLFYNRSTSTVFGNGTGNPENAIDASKIALLPGQESSFDNYTNYVRGLNGLIVDIANSNLGAITAADFQFATWDGVATDGFTATATLPTVEVLPGVGVGGSNRIKIDFEDHAIQNVWLKITVLSNANTGLVSDDVFYFGNAVGDMNTGNSGSPATVRTNATDVAVVRQNQSTSINSVIVSSIYDLNKDGRVNATDVSEVRQKQASSLIRHFAAPIPTALAFVPPIVPNEKSSLPAFRLESWLLSSTLPTFDPQIETNVDDSSSITESDEMIPTPESLSDSSTDYSDVSELIDSETVEQFDIISEWTESVDRYFELLGQ